LILVLCFPSFAEAQGVRARVSVKRILDSTGTLPTAGFFFEDAQIERAIAAANAILVASGADWQLELSEVVNLTGLSQWYGIEGHVSRTLEFQAMNDPSRYAWRDDAINLYVTRLIDWRGFCSIPDASGNTDIIIINNDAWFISPAPLPLATLPEEDDLDLAAGYLWLHEIGHYFNLCHTQGCCCGFVCGQDQDPTRDPLDDDDVADTFEDLECWGEDEIANWAFDSDYADLSIDGQQQVDDTLLNVMSYHREEIFAADTAVLTEGQLARMDVEMAASNGRRSHVMTWPRADIVLRPTTAQVFQKVEADASTSTPAEGRVLTDWQWDLGDGTQMSGPVVTHRFGVPGVYTVRLTIIDDLGVQTMTERVFFVSESPQSVGPWTSQDIGDAVGGAGLLEGDCLLGASSALGFGSHEDSFYFLHRPFLGDMRLTARVSDFRSTVSGGVAGILIRNGLSADSQYAGAFLVASGDADVAPRGLWRARTDEGTVRVERERVGEDGWIRVERRGLVISSYLSHDGTEWREMGKTDARFSIVVFVGVGIAGGTGDDLSEVFLASLCDLELERLEPLFRRGDLDSSRVVDITDAVLLLEFLILGWGELSCGDAADANDDGMIDISDALRVLTVIFLSGDIPAPGMMDCGEDPTVDELRCGFYEAPCF
jgi:hypothetical protein